MEHKVFNIWLCRTTSYLRVAKIVKGECNTKKKLAYFFIAESPPILSKDSERNPQNQMKTKFSGLYFITPHAIVSNNQKARDRD